ncbi:MAG: prenyltransferase/squalene oxidase repeat-containing protein [Acidobacteriota bacterium]
MMLYSEDLLGRQNADGGWSYFRGGSWTEPTCYALMALAASGRGHEVEVRRGMEWLQRCQRPDGGFAPRESVRESTWVTALTLLLPTPTGGSFDRPHAETWTVEQTGRESGWVFRLRLWMLGAGSSADSMSFDGWPWYPGAAAWVGPTALSILALQKMDKRGGGPISRSDLKKRIAQGRGYLLARRCRDGGWNHGSTRALGYDSDSYPETTGLALLALHGLNDPKVRQGVVRGEQQLAVCRSSEGASWLRLGLGAHGRPPLTPPIPNQASDGGKAPVMHGGVMEIAIAALAEAAQAGRNSFLDV